jgi:hypothetical protein
MIRATGRHFYFNIVIKEVYIVEVTGVFLLADNQVFGYLNIPDKLEQFITLYDERKTGTLRKILVITLHGRSTCDVKSYTTNIKIN